MDLQKYTQATSKAMLDTHTQSDFRRPHLGASMIGTECERAMWYSFRWVDDPAFGGRMLRLFETGQQQEFRLSFELKAIGVEVYDKDPKTGKQIHVEYNAHISGSCDGVGRGFPESPDKWHVIEYKTHNDRSFKELLKKGVQEAKPQHYAQMQVYMHLLNIDRAMYIAVNKNDDDIYSERVRLDVIEAERLLLRADRIVKSDRPPARISESEKAFACKFCSYKDICHHGKISLVSCRTCLHSTAGPNGWECALGSSLSFEDQKKGCGSHVYIPDLLPGEVVDSGEDYVEYNSGLKNGPGYVTSLEIWEGQE